MDINGFGNLIAEKRRALGLTQAELGRLVYETEGVANYHILEPVSDIEPAATALPVLKSLSVTAESGAEV